MTTRGAGIAQWSERRTRDRKVPGSSPGRSGGIIFFSRVNFLCWLLFWYLFHPRVTCKRSQSFCQKCRWQVTAKHTYTLPMWLSVKWQCKLVHGWMVYIWMVYITCAETAAVLRVPAMQQPKSAVSTPLPWMLKIRSKKGFSHSESHATRAQWVCSRAENSAM